jgi:glycine hydroxymethyltransferase
MASSELIQSKPLEDMDAEVFALINEESDRQREGLCLIASENFASKAVMEATGSSFCNKYAEGYPGRRYYGGTAVCDKLETLCQQRALAAFNLDKREWGVNVQAYSGSTANWCVQSALLEPHDRLMGLDLPSGGHLTHGYRTATRRLTASGRFFESMPYRVNGELGGLIDYDEMERSAALFRPKLLIAGASAYPRRWDYERMRRVADASGAYLMADISHISGLVAARLANDPFELCDVVTTTTHKTLRGPRGALIFFRRTPPRPLDGRSVAAVRAADAKPYNLEARINDSVFPANQGGPHMNAIAAIAVALKEAATPEFREYVERVRDNAAALAERLAALGHVIVSGGTDNHLLLVNVRADGLTGSKVERALELAAIYVNKNSIYGDKSALTPGGIRLGSPCLTSRGFQTKHFEQIGDFVHRAIDIAQRLQTETGSLLKNFLPALEQSKEIAALRQDVFALGSQFPIPG